ncbi:MAG: hypothetical protein ABEJ58_03285 [Halodesulfurarchaeum sp.]
MVDETIRDGPAIADLLIAEIEAFEEPPFDSLGLGDETPSTDSSTPETSEVEITYRGEFLCTLSVHPDRIFLEFRQEQAAVRDAAADVGLRVREKATDPPATLVFVERGADVKRVIDIFGTVLGSQ